MQLGYPEGVGLSYFLTNLGAGIEREFAEKERRKQELEDLERRRKQELEDLERRRKEELEDFLRKLEAADYAKALEEGRLVKEIQEIPKTPDISRFLTNEGKVDLGKLQQEEKYKDIIQPMSEEAKQEGLAGLEQYFKKYAPTKYEDLFGKYEKIETPIEEPVTDIETRRMIYKAITEGKPISELTEKYKFKIQPREEEELKIGKQAYTAVTPEYAEKAKKDYGISPFVKKGQYLIPTSIYNKIEANKLKSIQYNYLYGSDKGKLTDSQIMSHYYKLLDKSDDITLDDEERNIYKDLLNKWTNVYKDVINRQIQKRGLHKQPKEDPLGLGL